MKIALLLALPLATCALAHDLYLMPAKFKAAVGDKLVISVHNGDSFPGSEGTTDPTRLKDARLSDGTPFTDFRTLGKATHGVVEVRSKGSVWASLYTEPKDLTMEPEKFAAYLKEEGMPPVKHGKEMYSKYAKTLITVGAPDAGFSKNLGLIIEFIPAVNPATLQPGDKLPLQLLFRGKPLAGAQVEKAWVGGHSVVGRTDNDGRIVVPVETAGKWRIHTVTMEPHPDRSVADWQSFWASLTFENAGAKTTSQTRE